MYVLYIYLLIRINKKTKIRPVAYKTELSSFIFIIAWHLFTDNSKNVTPELFALGA